MRSAPRRPAQPRRGPLLCLVLLALAPAARARAYCRATTMQAPQGSDGCALECGRCAGTCGEVGTPLAWSVPGIAYTLNERGFPDIDEATLRETLDAAFSAWSDVACEGEPVGLRFVQEGGTTSLTVGPAQTEPNRNVISLLDEDTWRDSDYDPAVYANTKVWFVVQTGEIVGADIAFNGGIGTFAACEGPCDEGVVDLGNVATHEVGHLLGLAHSQEREATMWCSAGASEDDKRTLGEDDVAGLCATYGALPFRNGALLAPRTRGLWPGGCDAASSHADRGALVFLLVLAALASRRRLSA